MYITMLRYSVLSYTICHQYTCVVVLCSSDMTRYDNSSLNCQVDVKSFLEMYDLCVHTNFYSGAIGLNINVANTLVAVFLATGQDVACVVESSNAELIISPVSVEEIKEKGR